MHATECCNSYHVNTNGIDITTGSTMERDDAAALIGYEPEMSSYYHIIPISLVRISERSVGSDIGDKGKGCHTNDSPITPVCSRYFLEKLRRAEVDLRRHTNN